MTVKELMEKLVQYNPDDEVVVVAYKYSPQEGAGWESTKLEVFDKSSQPESCFPIEVMEMAALLRG